MFRLLAGIRTSDYQTRYHLSVKMPLARTLFSTKYRLQKWRYRFGVFTSNIDRTIAWKRISVKERCCCSAKCYQTLIQNRTISGFSQLNFFATSDLVGIDSELDIEVPQYSCLKCINEVERNNAISIFLTVDSFRKNRDFLNSTMEKLNPSVPCSLFIGFSEGKNFKLSEIPQQSLARIKQVYLENLEEAHSKALPLPIGFRDGKEKRPSNFPMSERLYIDIIKQDNSKKDMRILLSFSPWTHPSRIDALNLSDKHPIFYSPNIDGKKRVYKLPTGDMPPKSYFYNLGRFKFALSPRGGGLDTHRFYECIAKGTLPMVLRTNSSFDFIYQQFPSLVLNNWEEILEDVSELQHIYDNFLIQRNKLLMNFPNFSIDARNISEFYTKSYGLSTNV